MDHPFHEVVATANQAIAKGWTVYQKWTCAACGDRILMDDPNVFFLTGKHSDCKVDPERVTNIEEQGTNYLAHRDLR